MEHYYQSGACGGENIKYNINARKREPLKDFVRKIEIAFKSIFFRQIYIYIFTNFEFQFSKNYQMFTKYCEIKVKVIQRDMFLSILIIISYWYD